MTDELKECFTLAEQYQEPTMHKPIPIGTKVKTHESIAGGVTGTVAGISFIHIIFGYIIILDKPYKDTPYGEVKAITVPGTLLYDMDGSDFSLDVK